MFTVSKSTVIVMERTLRIMTFLVVCFWTSNASRCTFPPKWRGTWYQSGLGEIEIAKHSISERGHCKTNEGNKYLLLDRVKLCYVCLVFTPQHENVLQFKESFCVRDDEIASVCGRITGDFVLYTIVKVPSLPVPCPFQGPYLFAYTNHSESSRECREPMSDIQACADPSRFIFRYRHCHRGATQSITKLDFRCMATWFNGEKFLYGKFTGPGLVGNERKYRCFMYSFWSTHGEMSMSADATCQGLQSPRVGVLTMDLKHRLDQWPRPTCSFPEYFSNTKVWRDIGGQFKIELDRDNQVFRVMDVVDPGFIRYREERSETRLSVKCIDVFSDRFHSIHNMRMPSDTASRNEEIKIIAHTTNDSCVSAFQCIRLIKKAHSVVELILGTATQSQHSACASYNFHTFRKFTLIPMDVKPTACPFPGSYNYVAQRSDCSGLLDVGCTKDSEMVVKTRCPSGHNTVNIFECYQHWTDTNTQSMYIIVGKPGDPRKVSDCLVYKQNIKGYQIIAEESCGGGKLKIMDQPLAFIMAYQPAKCKVQQPRIISQPESEPNTDNPEDVVGVKTNRDTHNSNVINIIDSGNSRTACYYTTVILLLLTVCLVQR
ncbi:uncharacterized protein LOC121374190 [Gigantopelta aegis]|uniref:uncharacterized protein LOC121374190 n=1 Tax=Gigantopelta aegis TaxID=1735272 RepID=UPI001B88CB8B|nr:uncharacterized protein LOC121374190 [Gigantopelta aegis]